jgi:hypothetical protein
VNSDISATVTVPAGAASGKVSLTGPGGTATSSLTFEVLPPPKITSFTPTHAAEGATVTVTGSALTGADVTLGGDDVSLTKNTSTSITFAVPSDAHAGKIAITTSNGSVQSATSFGITPKVTSFDPTTGIVTSTFDVAGTGFNGVTTAKIGTKTAGVTVHSDISATVTVPAGAASGKVSFTAAGVTGTSATSFTVLPPPTVTTISPTKATEGTTVKVTGTFFSGATQVTLGGNSVSFTPSSSTSLKFVVPPGAASGYVAVTTPYGTGTSAAMFKVTPKILSFDPPSGPTGTVITLTGSGFDEVSSAKVGTKTAAFEVSADDSMTVTVPDGAASGKVSVTALGGTGSSSTSFTISHDDRSLASARSSAAVASTRLSIDVWPGGRRVAAGHARYVLACGPARGTVPHAARACSTLATLNAPFAKPKSAAPCPALALGPQEAHVVGLVRGVHVDAWLNLRGCGVGRWSRVKTIVPEPGHALMPS